MSRSAPLVGSISHRRQAPSAASSRATSAGIGTPSRSPGASDRPSRVASDMVTLTGTRFRPDRPHVVHRPPLELEDAGAGSLDGTGEGTLSGSAAALPVNAAGSLVPSGERLLVPGCS